MGQVACGNFRAQGRQDTSEAPIPPAARKREKTRLIGKEAQDAEAGVAGVEDLSAARRSRSLDAESREMIRRGMKEDPLCAALEEDQIDTVLKTMEFFEFPAGQAIVKQGEVGNTFFVVESGQLSVSVNGQSRNTLTRGMTFGGIALLYRCPRTASVTAVNASACWGASGATFQKVLQANAAAKYSEHRRFLDSMQIFRGLSAVQRDCIAEGVNSASLHANSRVVTEGEMPAYINFVKTGELRALKGGTVNPTGELVGGQEIGRLSPGQCFGDQELLRGAGYEASVVTTSACELLTVSAQHLREVLGEQLQASIEKAVVRLASHQCCLIADFPPAQQDAVIEAIAVRSYSSGEQVQSGLRFAIVLTGTLVIGRHGKSTTLVRGQWYEDDEQSAKVSRVAGPEGCRLAELTQDALASALQGFGFSAGARASLDLSSRARTLRNVPVFRHLSQEQTLMLARCLVAETYQQGAVIFKQGDVGTKFFVMASGEVRVSINGEVIRTLGKNAYFGERALLFDEVRSASIEVSSRQAEVWSMEKSLFSQIVEGNMQQKLVERIKLQDTNVSLSDLKHVKVIGAGASGAVRLVEHANTGTRYALKRVDKKHGKIPEEVQRECKLLAENDHPFIMHMVKTFETPKSVYMLTELITGGELHAAIRMIPTALSRAQAQFYTGSLVLVLEELAGRMIVYRDLKPENVMLDSQGYLKLVDFGIAKKLLDASRTFTVIGTPHYMAPEVLQGRGYGVEVDIWSLGVLLFEFVCGYLPFGDDLDNPNEVCQVVLRGALKFPSRYKDRAGRALMEAMIERRPKKRIGAGMKGFEEVKSHEFFQCEGRSSLFEQILSRTLAVPYSPKGECYADPREVADVILDDAKYLHRGR